MSVPQSPLPHVNDAKRFVDMIVEGCIAALDEKQAEGAQSA